MRKWVAALLVLVSTGVARAEGEAPVVSSNAERIEALEKQVQELLREREERNKRNGGSPAAGADGFALPEKGDGKEAKAEEKEKEFAWGFKDGFFVKGKLFDQPYELRPIGRIQLDYRSFPNARRGSATPPGPEDQFLIRRARIGFNGRFSVFNFTFEIDPLRQFPLGVFFFEYDQFPVARLRFGHFRAPFALENGMYGTNPLPFLERSMIIGSGNCLAPGFTPGVGVAGKFQDGLFEYFLSIQDQADTNATPPTGDPQYCARVQSGFNGFLVGANGLWARHGGRAIQSMTGVTPAQFRYFAPVNVLGWDHRYSADVSFFKGPFFVMAEYGWGIQDRERVLAMNTDASPLVFEGAYIGFGYVFWGPKKGKNKGLPFTDWEFFSLDCERPRPPKRFAGAEFVCRIEWINIEDKRLTGRRNPNGTIAIQSTAANTAKTNAIDARAITVGINVFPIENVRFSAEYVRVRIGDQFAAEKRSTRYGDEFIFRAQLDF